MIEGDKVMTMTQEKAKTGSRNKAPRVPGQRRVTGRRPAFRLEPSPYDLKKPLELAPARIRHDPRIASQRLTAFWVLVKDQHVGRVAMVEFEDRSGWFYQPEVMPVAGGLPKRFGEPLPKRRDAINAVIDEWRSLVKAAASEAGQ